MTRTTGVRIAALGAALLVAAACGSDDDLGGELGDVQVDETQAADAIESVDSVLDDAAGDIDDASADLAQTLRDNGLDSVAALVERVDLSSLTGGAEFTFFAPNNEAFTSLTADDTADLLTDPGSVVDVLRNHVVDEVVTADELAALDQIETSNGQTFPVTAEGDTVMIDGATVVQADIETGDGMVHIVDRILLP